MLSNFESKENIKTFEYLKEGIEAKAHTPIYKMHKYFARRPQNVFNYIIKHYTDENDIILDTFSGGGVTLFEGLSLNRRVVASDVNPLATFISRMQSTKVDVNEYIKYSSMIRDRVNNFAHELFQTKNRDTGELIPVRWYEHCYVAKCQHCGEETPLSNEFKTKKSGWYACAKCKYDLQAVNCERVGTKLLNVTYKITTRKTQVTVEPDDHDYRLVNYCDNNFKDLLEKHNLWVPDLEIPEEWDRQQEDCLHRKGIIQFLDFFTTRNTLVMAYFLKEIKAIKTEVSKEIYNYLLLTFSATIRYTNNLTISTSSWQDGRPVAWAKHAYWISNQFVEVNPIEYIDKRITAIESGLKFQVQRLTATTEVENFTQLENNEGNFLVFNKSSNHLTIPDGSIDMVLTDPPYGSNVQYGELSAFWLAWLEGELGITKKTIIDLSEEILIHRKKGDKSKSLNFYYEGLLGVFTECYRVLKPGRPLVFTFNNKGTGVWFAVIKAAVEAGFVLESDGVIYQTPIENYKNTAHTRYSGSLHGDFIYTFVKPLTKINNKSTITHFDIKKTIKEIVLQTVINDQGATTNDVYVNVFKTIIPFIANSALDKEHFEEFKSVYSDVSIDNIIESNCIYNESTNTWHYKTK
jgi:putative DNA methylase